MVGQKTHDQQQRIIKGEENTKGGGADCPTSAPMRQNRLN